MVETVRNEIQESLKSYTELPREEWMLQWPGQVVICVSTMFWTRDVEEALNRSGLQGLQVPVCVCARSRRLKTPASGLRGPEVQRLGLRNSCKSVLLYEDA